jgi:hypothetical protein
VGIGDCISGVTAIVANCISGVTQVLFFLLLLLYIGTLMLDEDEFLQQFVFPEEERAQWTTVGLFSLLAN